ncbi:MAG TPA: site-specific integrase [Burkholderiaceae bacterium]|nr:site-specific integrase [Burkholderiaceae bacterium]
MSGSEHKELLEDGKVLLHTRNGIFQARVYRGDRRYVYKSLKTRKLDEARKLALRFLHETEFKQQEGLPLKHLSFAQVIDEYVETREKQYEQGQLATNTTSRRPGVSIHMLRQIRRVVKFWNAYCGGTSVANIDNAALQGYIGWRKDYYHRMPRDAVPKNAKLNPTDKTLEWELTLGKTILKFAHDRGYRGKAQLPTYSFTAVNKIVRPAFLLPEYVTLYKEMRKWINEAKGDPERQHTRLLLRDYVLILANSGMRVGEANSLQWRDVVWFTDLQGRDTCMFSVRGKTGSRMVVPRVNARRYVERLAERSPDKKPDDYIFRMRDGRKVITLIDQFQHVLSRAKILENRHGERYTLYSLRHFYAVMMIRRGMPVFNIARNMGTSVAIIESYYGKQATSAELATRLGD